MAEKEMPLNEFEKALFHEGLRRRGATEAEIADLLTKVSIASRVVAGSGAVIHLNDNSGGGFSKFTGIDKPHVHPLEVFSVGFRYKGGNSAEADAFANDNKLLDFIELYNFDGELWPEVVEDYEFA